MKLKKFAAMAASVFSALFCAVAVTSTQACIIFLMDEPEMPDSMIRRQLN